MGDGGIIYRSINQFVIYNLEHHGRAKSKTTGSREKENQK